MSYESDEGESGPWSLILIGVLIIGFSWWMFSIFSGLEQSGGTLRINWIVALLYKIFGKWVVVGLIGFVGALCVNKGIQKLRDG